MTVRQKYLELHQAREQESHGAIALTFYNLFWIFFIVSIVGLFGETIVSFFRDGHWESRAGLVFGPFSPIYGTGAVLITIALNRIADKNPLVLFAVAGIVGAAFEYFAGWFFESVFGIVAWSYEGQLLSLHGHTCLLMAFVWGAIGLVWIKLALPFTMRLIGRIPSHLRRPLTTALAIVVFVDVALTIGAFDCWYMRSMGMPIKTAQQAFFAYFFNDEFMQTRFETMSMWASLAIR